MAFRTDIPIAGANAKVAEHNLHDFRHFHPTAGNIFFVDSGVDGTGGKSPDDAVGTIDELIASCTASQGDTIYVLPGHAENISSATGLVVDVAGINIIGLGNGSLRPTLTLDTAAGSTVSVTAANTYMRNFKILSNFTNGVTAGITLGASADGATLVDIQMDETSATKEYLIGISIAAACHDVTISGLKYNGTSGGTTSSAITLAGACNNFKLIDSYIHADCSGGIIDGSTAASTHIEVHRNVLGNLDTTAGLGGVFHNSCTGFVTRNLVTNLKDAVAAFSGTGLYYHENYGSNAAGAQGTIAIGLAADT